MATKNSNSSSREPGSPEIYDQLAVHLAAIEGALDEAGAETRTAREVRAQRVASDKMLGKGEYVINELTNRNLYPTSIDRKKMADDLRLINKIPALQTKLEELSQRLNGLQVDALHRFAAAMGGTYRRLKAELPDTPDLEPFYRELANLYARNPTSEKLRRQLKKQAEENKVVSVASPEEADKA